MILRRLGNKTKIAKKIQGYFPQHKMYVEPFFGAGGMFFHKPRAKYNIVNDLDSDVFNLFNIVMRNREELLEGFKKLPIHSDLLNYWNENTEEDGIMKALRFLYLSNFTFMGNGGSQFNGAENPKEVFYSRLEVTFDYLDNVQFFNKDFSKFLSLLREKNSSITFIYCDPPYLGTSDNYSNSFTEEQSEQLFDSLEKTKCKYAMSEFDHPFILRQAKDRGLNIIYIGERQNLKNRRTEILVTNYQNAPTLFS